MKNLKVGRASLFLFFCLAIAACAISQPTVKVAPDMDGKATEGTGQVLLVAGERFLFWTYPALYAFEQRDGAWRQAFAPMTAAVGKNGVAPPGKKREGDGRTPSGSFRLGHAFGYAPQIDTRMPYRQATPDDLWVDDPQAPDYNRWVKRYETRAGSYEKMKRDDDQYKYGVVIEYNTDPVIPGHGSAIFLHVRKSTGSPTAGCVAVSEEDMLKILGWLDPAAQPVIIIRPDGIQQGETDHE